MCPLLHQTLQGASSEPAMLAPCAACVGSIKVEHCNGAFEVFIRQILHPVLVICAAEDGR